MKTRHHPIRSAQGTRQLRPDALREDSRRDGEEGGSMRSGSLGKVWLLFSLRAASQKRGWIGPLMFVWLLVRILALFKR